MRHRLYKLIIFDFDGTLVDSIPGMIDVMRQVISNRKLPQSIYDKWQKLLGIPLERQLELLFPDQDEKFRREMAAHYRTIYDGSALAICRPFPGLINTLSRLKQSGIITTIASSKRRHKIELVLEHHQLNDYFDLIVGPEDVIKQKPHPEAVHLTLKTFSIEPKDALVVGDSLYDLEMAHSAGVDAIAVTTGAHNEETLRCAQSKYLVMQLEDILPIILNGQSANT